MRDAIEKSTEPAAILTVKKTRNNLSWAFFVNVIPLEIPYTTFQMTESMNIACSLSFSILLILADYYACFKAKTR